MASPTSERTLPLARPRTVIGRSEDCDIVVDDETVSRQHVVLEREGSIVRFRDLGGTNVPLLDGRPARDGTFQPGSMLVIGRTRLVLEREPAFDETRVLAAPQATSRIVRPAPVHDRGARLPRELLNTLSRAPLHGPDFVMELVPQILRCALELSGRTRGVLATIGEPGKLLVLASVPTDPAAFPLPSHAAEEPLEPVCVDPWPAGPAERDRVIVPLDHHGERDVLVLGVPEPDAPAGEHALEILMSYARIAARELADARGRERDARELQRIRFSRSYASRTVLASARLQTLRRRVTEAAVTGEPLLLLGEDGCETEEIAAFYHAHASGGAGDFVACYARLLPQRRIAQDLARDFSIQEGAGTCDVRARGGTLYVDSPESLRPELQRRLAELIEANRTMAAEQRFRIVLSIVLEDGGGRPRLDRALETTVRDWITATVPPLRGCPEDVSALTELVLDEMGPSPSGKPRCVSAEADRLLRAYRWPGNTGQHRRVVETAAARAGAEVVQPRHLPDEVRDTETGDIRVQTLREVEQLHVYRVLSLCGHNKERAARKLGISPSTLHGKLQRYQQDG